MRLFILTLMFSTSAVWADSGLSQKFCNFVHSFIDNYEIDTDIKFSPLEVQFIAVAINAGDSDYVKCAESLKDWAITSSGDSRSTYQLSINEDGHSCYDDSETRQTYCYLSYSGKKGGLYTPVWSGNVRSYRKVVETIPSKSNPYYNSSR